jgi:hypothetical protein
MVPDYMFNLGNTINLYFSKKRECSVALQPYT